MWTFKQRVWSAQIGKRKHSKARAPFSQETSRNPPKIRKLRLQRLGVEKTETKVFFLWEETKCVACARGFFFWGGGVRRKQENADPPPKKNLDPGKFVLLLPPFLFLSFILFWPPSSSSKWKFLLPIPPFFRGCEAPPPFPLSLAASKAEVEKSAFRTQDWESTIPGIKI